MLEMTAILGNLGNFVGAIGVVGSLVYLAIQVRHSRESTNANTRALDDAHRLALAQTYQARSAALQESALFVAWSADFAEIFTRIGDPTMPRAAAAAAFEELSTVQRFRCYNFLNAHRIRLYNLVFQYQQGMLTDEYYNTGCEGTPALLCSAVGDPAGGLSPRRCPSRVAAACLARRRRERPSDPSHSDSDC